jgi:hypothetical protein
VRLVDLRRKCLERSIEISLLEESCACLAHAVGFGARQNVSIVFNCDVPKL